MDPSDLSQESDGLTPVKQKVPKVTLSEPSGGRHSQSRSAEVKAGNQWWLNVPEWRVDGLSERKTTSDVGPRYPPATYHVEWVDDDELNDEERESPMLARMKRWRQQRLTPSRRYLGEDDSEDDVGEGPSDRKGKSVARNNAPDDDEWLDEYPVSRRLEFTDLQPVGSRSHLATIAEDTHSAIQHVSGFAGEMGPIDGPSAMPIHGPEAHGVQGHPISTVTASSIDSFIGPSVARVQHDHIDQARTHSQHDVGDQVSLESLASAAPTATFTQQGGRSVAAVGNVWQAQDDAVLSTVSARLGLAQPGQQSTVGHPGDSTDISGSLVNELENATHMLEAYRLVFADQQRSAAVSAALSSLATQVQSSAASVGTADSDHSGTTVQGAVNGTSTSIHRPLVVSSTPTQEALEAARNADAHTSTHQSIHHPAPVAIMAAQTGALIHVTPPTAPGGHFESSSAGAVVRRDARLNVAGATYPPDRTSGVNSNQNGLGAVGPFTSQFPYSNPIASQLSLRPTSFTLPMEVICL